MFDTNILLDTDSYKFSHYEQYPPNTTEVFAYLEARKGAKYNQTVFFGLKYILLELEKRITMEMVEQAKEIATAHGLPFNYEGWKYIAVNLKGKLPLEIRAPEEGTLIPIDNVLLTVKNTDPKCYWLTSYIETFIMRIWYPITVATQSWYIKQIIKNFINETSDVPEQINFKLHDFGSRGVNTREGAAIGGTAHLVNFMGTDTVAAIMFAREFYGEPMAGFSIPAGEHSSYIAWGKENEDKAYENMLDKFAKPNALLAVVSDSYDLENAIKNIWGKKLKQKVIASGATVVIRPDSGNPVEVALQACQWLEECYGATYNTKGYKVLNNMRVIYGDGINEETIRGILNNLKTHGYAVDNIAFGMGGALLQMVNRDTQRFAYKASEVVVDGKPRDVAKTPKTDPTKTSKAGKVDLVYLNGKYLTVKGEKNFGTVLKTVFLNGDIAPEAKNITLAKVRENANR